MKLTSWNFTWFFLQFSPICRPLASAAWCGPHPPHHPRYASVSAKSIAARGDDFEVHCRTIFIISIVHLFSYSRHIPWYGISAYPLRMINTYFSDTEAVEACASVVSMWCDVMWYRGYNIQSDCSDEERDSSLLTRLYAAAIWRLCERECQLTVVRRFGGNSHVADGPVRDSSSTQDQSRLRHVRLLLPTRSSSLHPGNDHV